MPQAPKPVIHKVWQGRFREPSGTQVIRKYDIAGTDTTEFFEVILVHIRAAKGEGLEYIDGCFPISNPTV